MKTKSRLKHSNLDRLEFKEKGGENLNVLLEDSNLDRLEFKDS